MAPHRDQQNWSGVNFHVWNKHKTYWFAVQAVKAGGTSQWVNSAATPPPPCEVGSLKAITGTTHGTTGGSIVTAWDSAKRAHAYNVNYRPSGGQWQRIQSNVTATMHTGTVSNASGSYTVAVQSTKDNGMSQWSNANVSAWLTTSSVAATTATLNLAGHSGDWYVKQTAPTPAGNCSTAISGASHDLTGLTSGASHTYAAYTDAACANEIAGTTFSTTSGVSVSNLDETGTGSCAVGNLGGVIGDNYKCATSFTTGNSAASYKLDRVTADFLAKEGNPGTFTMALHADSGGSPAASAVTNSSFSGGDPDSAGNHTYTCSGAGCSISGSATYWVVVSAAEVNGNNNYKWRVTTSDLQTRVPSSGNTSAGWSIGDTGKNKMGAVGWQNLTGGITGTFKVVATEQPALSATSITATGATLNISKHTAAWWYKSATTGATDCTSVAANTASTDVTGLTPGASYTFSAYSDSTCTTGNLLASATAFNTPGITLSETAISVSEGGTATYTVKLATQPTHNVSIAVGVGSTSSGSNDADITVQDTDDNTTDDQTTAIVFSSTNWNTARTVTIAIAIADDDDTDTANGSRAITHTATSADTNYSGATASLTATEADTTVTLTASGVTATGATLSIVNRTTAWWYKSATTGATTCTSVAASTSAVTLTTLTPGTSYTFTAYSDSAYSTSLASAATFTTGGVSVSNLGEDGAFGSGMGLTARWAGEFKTGSNSSGYTLHSATTRLYRNAVTSGILTWTIQESTTSGSNVIPTDTVVATLTTNSDTLSTTEYKNVINTRTESQSNDCTLDGNKTYFLVGTVTGTGSPQIHWNSTTALNETLVPSGNGWEIGKAWYSNYSNDAWGNWATYASNTLNDVTKFQVSAIANPALSATSVTVSSATLNIANHSGAWWYKRTAGTPASSTRHSVASGTTTAILSSLNAGTSYTYKAYNNSGCNAADEIASETFTTAITLTASSVTGTGATLTIAGHTAAWHYKSTTAGKTTCTSVAANTASVNVTGLTAGTSYTFSAYSDALYRTGNLLATATAFTTPSS